MAQVPRLSDDAIRGMVGYRSFFAGAEYLRQGRVSELVVDPQGRMVTASVQGARLDPYRVVVSPVDGRRRSGRCSCPMSVDCKHVAAVLLAARAAAEEPVRRSWEDQVAPLLRPRPTDRHSHGLPMALLVEEVAPPARPRHAVYGSAGAPSGPRLRIRPLIRSPKGNWVRTGGSWREVQHGHGGQPQLPAHRQVLRELLTAYLAGMPSYYSHTAETIYLDEVGPSVWHLLDRLRAAGVELQSADGRQVVLTAPVRAGLDLRRDDDGQVSLRPVLRSGDDVFDASSVRLLGDPLLGVFATRHPVLDRLAADVLEGPPGLVLTPLSEAPDERVAALLRDGSPVRIPEADLPTFFSSYYPRLRQVVEVSAVDGSVTPPEVRPPVLTLTVTFGALDAHLEWAFAYRSDTGEVRVPLDPAPAPDDGIGAGAVRDPEEEDRVLGSLDPAVRAYLAPQLQLTGMSAVTFTTVHLPALLESELVEVTVVGDAPDFRPAQAEPVIALGATDSDDRDWFDLAVSVSVEGQDVPFDQLFRALALKQTHLVLPSGLYLRLDVPALETLRQLIEEARGLQDRASKGLRVSVYQTGLWEELLELGVVETQSARWAGAVAGLLDLEKLEPPPDPAGFAGTLRPYQRDGFNWLAFLWRHGLGGILADDMGLGKTVQTLAMICHARESGDQPGPFLVVAPTSVVGNWEREASRFAPGLSVRAVTETTRRSGTPLAEVLAGADLVVTSYALLRIDAEAYLGLDWAGLILDEAQFVKNHQAKTYQAARRLPAPFKLAVTGTPLENSLMDLWSLFSIVAPGLYPSPQRFSEDYRRPIERGEAPELLARLRRRVRPLMLRRTKEQVVAELPPKQEQVLEVVLDPKHQRVYQTHLQRERRKVLGLLDDLDHNRFEILKSLTLLRQLSLAPQLVDPAYAGVPASKVEVFLETLGEVVGEGHRALVFSQFTGFLKVVRDRLDAEGIRYSYLDGRTRKRAERIEEFKTGDAPVFLISLKAGGVGLNLTEADYCFILDPWWNPAVEAQAVDRTHRIGQDKTVIVYRLVATGTIEEKVMELKARKQSLFDRVVDADDVMSAPLSVEDIKGLFR